MRLVWTLAALVCVAAGAVLHGGRDVAAQAPPTRVFGAVTVNGEPPPPGTVVEAFVGGMPCGQGEVRDLGDPIGIGFVVDVDADAFNPGCGNDGETITFKVGGLDAPETATFQTGAFVQRDLTTAGAPASPPPAQESPSPAPATPSPSPVATPTSTPTATPAASPSPSPSPSPTEAGTPEASPTGTATSTPTATATVTPTATASPTPTPTTIQPDEEDGDGGGVSPVVWGLGGLVVLAVAGIGAYVVYRRGR
ncbi:MAG: hypothetical protein ACRDJ9_02840 [Dehalococcoidia bacterium]